MFMSYTLAREANLNGFRLRLFLYAEQLWLGSRAALAKAACTISRNPDNGS